MESCRKNTWRRSVSGSYPVVAPTVTMTDPGSPLSGTRTFAATAADAHSGLATVEIQYAASGTSTWKSLCTIEAEPWSCRAATNDLANGTYSFRAIATDEAGNATTSAAVVTVTSPDAAGYITAWPCGETMPYTSIGNYRRGQTVANNIVVAVGSSGALCLYSSVPTHLIVDFTGVHR